MAKKKFCSTVTYVRFQGILTIAINSVLVSEQTHCKQGNLPKLWYDFG